MENFVSTASSFERLLTYFLFDAIHYSVVCGDLTVFSIGYFQYNVNCRHDSLDDVFVFVLTCAHLMRLQCQSIALFFQKLFYYVNIYINYTTFFALSRMNTFVFFMERFFKSCMMGVET